MLLQIGALMLQKTDDEYPLKRVCESLNASCKNKAALNFMICYGYWIKESTESILPHNIQLLL